MEAWDTGKDEEQHSSAFESQICRFYLITTELISYEGP